MGQRRYSFPGSLTRVIGIVTFFELLILLCCVLGAGIRKTSGRQEQAVMISGSLIGTEAEQPAEVEETQEMPGEEAQSAQEQSNTVPTNSAQSDPMPSETEQELSAAGETSPEMAAAGTVSEPGIRVRLTVSDYSSEYHEFVTISCDGTFQLQTGEKAQIYTGGQTVTISRDHPFFQDGSIRVSSETGGVRIDSIAHRNLVNTYPGILDLYLEDAGIRIVNELGLEAYVERVVPSEMPASYGREAAMLQAVCTRTYAYQKLTNGVMDAYGAAVNDSTDYQVYNAAPVHETSSLASSDTRGIVMTWQGKPFVPYFFSTSCGYNSDNAIWGGEILPFLRTQNLTYQGEINYYSEEEFRAFIMNWDYPAYEDDCTWYRWNYTIGLEDLKQSLSERLTEQLAAGTGIRAVDSAGAECTADPLWLNGLQNIVVTKRLSGGMAGEVAILCEQGTICLDKEMVIRNVFGSPARVYINRSSQGRSESEGNYLPSAFFYPCANYEGDQLISFTFYGGGNGHGIGLSQNAAHAMLQMGLTWQEVLQFFYLGTGMTKMYP
ncbi:MAG: SpoIID/LytB domain-containing protein [Lachnospiraceae bacterium]|nr:SpoIID/LytB domain-containing protein [Lachnospiraceae bacterium]